MHGQDYEMSQHTLETIEDLCHESIQAGINRLFEAGVLPRPPAARNLRLGYDYTYPVIEGIEEADNLIKYLISLKQIRKNYIREDERAEHGEWHLYQYWTILLEKICNENQSREVDINVFRKWFNKFIKELFSQYAIWISIDTLCGLKLIKNEFNLDRYTKLSSLDAWNIVQGTNDILLGQGQDLIFDWHISGHDRATIITQMRIPKHLYKIPFPDYPGERLFNTIQRSMSVIESIRLVMPGSPWIHCHVTAHLSEFPLARPLYYCLRDSDPGPLGVDEVLVNNADFRKIKRLWHDIMNSSLAPDLDNPRFRFTQSYQGKYWIDNIVDLTIALESLFSPADSQELKHRISIRTAWLISSDVEPVNKTYRAVRAMYEIRNKRVHGGVPEESDVRRWLKMLTGERYEDSRDWELKVLATEKARGIVRKAIMACNKLSRCTGDGPRWPFPEDFDENILIRSKRKEWQNAAGLKRTDLQ